MQPLARLGDTASCPNDSHSKKCCSHGVSGPAVSASDNVFVHGIPALRIGDKGVHSGCCGANTWVVAGGSSVVKINGIPAARLGDPTTHCGGSGQIVTASSNVLIK